MVFFSSWRQYSIWHCNGYERIVGRYSFLGFLLYLAYYTIYVLSTVKSKVFCSCTVHNIITDFHMEQRQSLTKRIVYTLWSYSTEVGSSKLNNQPLLRLS